MRFPLSIFILALGSPLFSQATDTRAPSGEPPAFSGEDHEEKMEEALERRRLHRAEIRARQSAAPGARSLAEEHRRHARESFVRKNDLNGDGKVDQYELKRMVEDSRKAQADKARERAQERSAADAGKGEPAR